MNSMEPLLRLEDVTKVFYTDEVETHALSGVHLEIHKGDYVSVAGPSGCGKSTLLSILVQAGVETPAPAEAELANYCKDHHLNTKTSEMAGDRANEIYLAFCGSVDHTATAQLLQTISRAVADGVDHVHLLLQSNGGSVADGICLYNFFQGLPITLTAYNTGTIRSAGVLAYLGAKHRKASQYATFVLHHCRRHNESGSATQMKAIADGLLIEQARMEAVLRTHIDLTAEQWSDFDRYDLVLTPEQALQVGLATEVGEFLPPPNASLHPLEAVRRL